MTRVRVVRLFRHLVRSGFELGYSVGRSTAIFAVAFYADQILCPNPEIKCILYWAVYNRFSDVTGLASLLKLFVKIILFLRTSYC